MPRSILRILCSARRSPQPQPIHRNNLSPLEREVVDEVNLARTQPKKYAFFLVDLKSTGAVDEAIHFLRSVAPLHPLRLSMGMSLGAKDHVEKDGPAGAVGHTGRDGSQPWDRVNRYGTWHGSAGENISYGSHTAREIVRSLIVDEGVGGRGHRKNIFNPDFSVIGVACGHHSTYQTMCVMTFAGGYSEG